MNNHSRVNKYTYEYVIQGNYGYGWEDLTTEDNIKEARARLREYRQDEPQFPHRRIRRRILNPLAGDPGQQAES